MISKELPLDGIDSAFDAMVSGESIRTVLVPLTRRRPPGGLANDCEG